MFTTFIFVSASIFSETEFNDEVILLVLPSNLEEVLARLLAKGQINLVCVEPQLDYLLLLLSIDVAREDSAEQRRLALLGLHIKYLELLRVILQLLYDILQQIVVPEVRGIVYNGPIVACLAHLLRNRESLPIRTLSALKQLPQLA